MCFSWFRIGKMKFRHCWPLWKKALAMPWKNPLLAPSWKRPSDVHDCTRCTALTKLRFNPVEPSHEKYKKHKTHTFMSKTVQTICDGRVENNNALIRKMVQFFKVQYVIPYTTVCFIYCWQSDKHIHFKSINADPISL